MAINANAYSPKQFQFLIAEQDDMGTFNAESGGDSTNWVSVDVDSIGSPSLNVLQGLEHRTGSRVLQTTDFFQNNVNTVKEITVSGTATIPVMDLLYGNITQGDTVTYGVASNVGSQSFTSATANQTANQILSIIYKSPSSGNSLAFKDCFCTSVSISGDMGTEGGRMKFSATFKTGSVVQDLTEATITTVDTTFSSVDGSNYYMYKWDADDRIIVDVANVLVNSFSFTVENDVVFSGGTTTGFESMVRAGEISATADFNIKYDDNTDGLFELYNNQSVGASEGATLMATDDTPSDGDGFEFKFAKSILTNVAFSEGDIMNLDVSVKALGNGSDLLFEIGC
tara:strand:- start:42 stop:1064 length:1023 start_codon:yes stop_codon:yes gene_type:complete